VTERLDRDLAALDAIEELLEVYADARLAPSGPVLARMRTQFLREVAAQHAIAVAERRLARDEGSRGPRWGLPRLRVPRRAAPLALAATLTLGASAAVLAASPGSPLYGARVAIQTALLPAQVDARLAAHEELLNQRLREAEAAAAHRDLVGLAAALAAYQAEVTAAVADVGDDEARLAHLEAELARHTAMLQSLAAQLPEQAAIEHAIDVSQKAATKLKDTGSHPAGRPTDTPGGAPNNQPGR
jgi:hypothetical protein